MHYEGWQLLLIFVLWTFAIWISTGTYLLIWEGQRPDGRPKDGQVRKRIVWFALKTALLVGGGMILSFSRR